jgi:octaprenyl-diphosphate synthase
MLIAQPKADGRKASPAPAAKPRSLWTDIMVTVNPFLSAVATRLGEQVANFEPGIAAYAQYALSQSGKQLRPTLVALSGRAAGKPNEDLITVAVIIEMVHLATLVHDDIMDAAQIRRRRPTLAANWGSEVSVLLGDCLFAQALSLAASFPTPEVCRTVAVATRTVCSGEILQTQQRGNFNLSQAEYIRLVAMKTAELFVLSCDLGAGLSGAAAPQREALRSFGLALGTAYQIFDDCLDLFGSEQVAGKSLGTDIANGKYTLPLLLAMEQANAVDLKRLKALLHPWDRNAFPEVLGILAKCEALAGSRQVIHQFLDSARKCLDLLKDTEHRTALQSLVAYLAQQTDGLGVTY